MPLQTIYLDAGTATQEADGKLEPVTEFRLFAFGANETTQGKISLSETGAKKVMAAYEKRTKAREGYLDIDWFHLSRKSDARLEDRRSAGRCKLELREDGIWVVGIRPTAEARRSLEADEVRSYSPVVSVSAKGQLLEIVQLSLTNIPAMDAAGLLAADEEGLEHIFKVGDRVNVKGKPHVPGHDTGVVSIVADSPAYGITFDGTDMAHKWYIGTELGEVPNELEMTGNSVIELSVTPFQSLPLYTGATWDAKAADLRVREFLSSDGSDDFEKIDLVKYRKAFVFFDGEEPEKASRYKGQILDVQDMGNGPELVVSKKAVQTLGAIIQGSRGGIKISDSDREKGKAILSRYYELFDAVAPWDRQQEQPVETGMEEPPMPMPMSPIAVHLMLEAKWSNEMRDVLAKAIGYRFGEHSYLEDWSPEKVRVCVYDEGPMPSKHFEIPYTMTSEKVDLGEPVEVVMSYVPKAQASEMIAMQERLTTGHQKLLDVTGKTSTSEAIVTLEALLLDASKVPGLEQQIKELEDERFASARAELTAKAKREGRWTAALEERGDEVVKMAKRLGDDTVKTLDAHWSAAPVIVAPGGMTPPKHEVELRLSEDEDETAKYVAKSMNRPLEDVRKSMLEHKRSRAQR